MPTHGFNDGEETHAACVIGTKINAASSCVTASGSPVGFAAARPIFYKREGKQWPGVIWPCDLESGCTEVEHAPARTRMSRI